MAKVLVAGVYLADIPTWVTDIVPALSAAMHHSVTQRWIALWRGPVGSCSVPHTVLSVQGPAPKFELLNRVLEDADAFDWVIIADDDVIIPANWVDSYLALADRFDFALSQPARTRDSFIDHQIVAQAPGLLARRTRFVEIGPVFCIRRDALPLLVPFETDIGMGWGLDFIWPIRLEKSGKRIGIVDATPVAHSLREQVQLYEHTEAHQARLRLLDRVPHLSRPEAFRVLESYPDA
jgi:hypothetical protein